MKKILFIVAFVVAMSSCEKKGGNNGTVTDNEFMDVVVAETSIDKYKALVAIDVETEDVRLLMKAEEVSTKNSPVEVRTIIDLKHPVINADGDMLLFVEDYTNIQIHDLVTGGKRHIFASYDEQIYTPAMSRDNKFVYYSDTHNGGFYKCNINTREKELLSDSYLQRISYPKDPNFLVGQMVDENGIFFVSLFDLKENEHTLLTEGLHPFYMPKYDKIIFSKYINEDSVLYMVGMDGANPVKLLDGSIYNPSVNRAGNVIAFSKEGAQSLYKGDFDGVEVKNVTRLFENKTIRRPIFQVIRKDVFNKLQSIELELKK